MKKFNELEYKRLDYEKIKEKISKLIDELENCIEFTSYIEICKQIILIQNHIEEMCDYADIRNMRDSKDDFFSNEIKYWNEYKPKFDLLFLPFYNSIINSKFIEELHKFMPDNFFNTIEYQMRITSDATIELQQKENKLKTRYRELNVSKIMYDGQERSLPYISGDFANKDRNIRKKAHDTINDFYYSKQKEYDQLLFELICVRNEIAKKLGFIDYSEYSLYLRRRFGYNYHNIKTFRDNIIKFIVPLCKKVTKWQKEELALDKLMYYDTIYFSKMPQTLYTDNELLEKLSDSFERIDSDLAKVYSDMLSNGYIDLLQRENKINFAITNYLTETAMPTITSNFKNNYTDIQTTTHEMGHSYQKVCASRKDKEYIVSALLKYPTFEIAEMFSYAMELLCMDNVENLFSKQDYNKYCFMKIYDMLSKFPYACLVDEFQETIYSIENLKVEDIRKIWIELTEKYDMKVSNSGHPNLESGGYFFRQTHIYTDPFYFIDYALSYFGAYAIYNKCHNDLELFKEIGEVASYYPFDVLIKKYNMPNPFEEDVVKDIADTLEKELIKKKI